jgi:hypothetical protein
MLYFISFTVPCINFTVKLSKMEPKPVGGQWLKERYNLVNYTMTHSSYIADNADIRLTSKGNVEQEYGVKYAVTAEQNALHHLEFYLKYDDISLDFLQAVLTHVTTIEVQDFINESPASKYARKIGFLYEFLTDAKLTLEKSVSGNYVDLLDEKRYLTGRVEKNTRWRVNNNLLGTAFYCPIVRKTKELEQLLAQDLSEKIDLLKADYPEDVFRRATNYLYTKETKSSYEIEKEEPSADREQKFVDLLQMAGTETNAEMVEKRRLITLQNAIVDPRFAAGDYRNFQNYVGNSTGNGTQYFHYVCPPPAITASLMEGLKYLAIKTADDVPAEIRAGVISFGFVFIHPFEDGNGRLHRFLIHDVLAHDKKVQQGIIIPVSAHMLHNIKGYDNILEKYSRPLMQRLKYTTSAVGEVTITNPKEVEGYYRYPDLTDHCVYLINTIHETVKTDMPKELTFLQNYDEAKRAIQKIVDMPDRMIDMMLTFLHQNKGVFPKKRRDYFVKLGDNEIQQMQDAYQVIYGHKNYQ